MASKTITKSTANGSSAAEAAAKAAAAALRNGDNNNNNGAALVSKPSAPSTAVLPFSKTSFEEFKLNKELNERAKDLAYMWVLNDKPATYRFGLCETPDPTEPEKSLIFCMKDGSQFFDKNSNSFDPQSEHTMLLALSSRSENADGTFTFTNLPLYEHLNGMVDHIMAQWETKRECPNLLAKKNAKYCALNRGVAKPLESGAWRALCMKGGNPNWLSHAVTNADGTVKYGPSLKLAYADPDGGNAAESFLGSYVINDKKPLINGKPQYRVELRRCPIEEAVKKGKKYIECELKYALHIGSTGAGAKLRAKKIIAFVDGGADVKDEVPDMGGMDVEIVDDDAGKAESADWKPAELGGYDAGGMVGDADSVMS
jgi:hypothetical protein